MDYAHKKTEGMLNSLEKRLAHEYAQAERELTDKLDDYMWRHSVKDRIWLNKVANGEITWERYQQWKIGQVCIGERWTEMRDTIAEDMHHTNEIAGSIVNGYLPEVYALNHNYATYEAEVGALVDTSYTLYDRQTVERMMRDNPDMLPPPGKRVSERIRAGRDVRWNEQQLQSITTQAILQGEGIPQLAGRIQSTFGDSFTIDDIRDVEHKTASQIAHELTKKNKSAAIRNARTMMTGAQNAGRVDGYKRAKDMGIDLRQQWLATLDGRTRHEHRQLDGQIVDVGEPFKVDGYEIRFPGDPTAEAHLVYNCRCTLIAAIKGFEHDLSDTSSRYDANLEGMTYEEWKKAKEPKKTAEKSSTGAISLATPTQYTMADLAERAVNDFEFGNGTAHGVRKTGKATVYTTPDGTEFVFPKPYNKQHQTMTPEQLLQAYNNIPDEIRGRGQRQIVMHDVYNPQDSYWRKHYKNFTHSYATGGDTIDFWRHDREHDDDYLVEAISHEMAHLIDWKDGYLKGERYSRGEDWSIAMSDDIIPSKGKKSPTRYGENDPAEDFAESFAQLVKDHDKFAEAFPNRYAIIRDILMS